MKRTRVLALSAALLGSISMLQIAEPASAAVDDPIPAHWVNLLQNPSFETCQAWGRNCYGSTAHWSPVNHANAVAVRSAGPRLARYGSYYGEIATQTPRGSVAQDITHLPVPSDTSYRFEMWVRPASSSSLPLRGTLALWGLGGGLDEHAAADFTLNSRDWTLVSVELDMSAAHDMMRAEIYIDTTYQWLAIDGAQVVRTGLDHGSFEGGGGRWRPYNLAESVNFTTYQEPAPHEGAWFGEMNTLEPGGSIAQDVYPRNKLTYGIPANQHTYCFSIWARSRGDAPFSGAIAIWSLGAGHQEQSATNFTVGHDWTQVSTCLRPAFAHDGLRVEIYMNTPDMNFDVDATRLDLN